MKYELELATPTVILDVKPRDVANKLAPLQVEFKRYDIEEAAGYLSEIQKLEEASETKEGSSFWENPSFITALEAKEILRKHIVDFKNVKGMDEATGKPIKVPSVRDRGDFETYYDMLWKHLPYRNALRSTVLQVLLNTSSTANLAA